MSADLSNIRVLSHVVQLQAQASGLIGPAGGIAKGLVLEAGFNGSNEKLKILMPTGFFGFLVPDLPCFVTIEVTQVQAQPEPAPALLGLNGKPI